MTTQPPQDGPPITPGGVRIYNPDGSYSIQPDTDPRMRNLADLQDRARDLRDRLREDRALLRDGTPTAAQQRAILARAVTAGIVALRLALPDDLDVTES